MTNCIAGSLPQRTPEFERLFEELFKIFRPQLINFANSVIHDTQAAEDIVTDVFIRFWKSPKKYNSESKAKGLLFVSTKNACLNFLEQRKYRKRELKSFIVTQATHTNLMSEIIKKDVLLELYDLLDNLPPKTKMTTVLCYMGRSNYKTIAKWLNRSPNTVRNTLVRALKQMKKNFRFEEAA